MELLNPRFLPLLEKILKKPDLFLVGTILFSSHPKTDPLKNLPGTQVVEVTKENRDYLPGEIARRIGGENFELGR